VIHTHPCPHINISWEAFKYSNAQLCHQLIKSKSQEVESKH
jgi:hypothetical protein